MNLARTELGVMPCVAFLNAAPTSTASIVASASSALSRNPLSAPSSSSSTPNDAKPPPTIEESLIPRLDAKEVAAVFTAPFHNFLRSADEQTQGQGQQGQGQGHTHTASPAGRDVGVEAAGFPADWYQGSWTDWHESRWRMHNFYVPIAGQAVARPKREKMKETNRQAPLPYGQQRDTARRTQSATAAAPTAQGSSGRGSGGGSGDDSDHVDEHDPLAGLSRFRVFGMTARIMVDAARVAYAEEPDFEHNSHFGDEEMIGRLLRMGRMGPIRKRTDEVTREDMVAASKL